MRSNLESFAEKSKSREGLVAELIRLLVDKGIEWEVRG